MRVRRLLLESVYAGRTAAGRARALHCRHPGSKSLLPPPMPAVRVTRETTTIKPPTRSWPRPAAGASNAQRQHASGHPGVGRRALAETSLLPASCCLAVTTLAGSLSPSLPPLASCARQPPQKARSRSPSRSPPRTATRSTTRSRSRCRRRLTSTNAARARCRLRDVARAVHTARGLIASSAATAICRPVRPAALRPHDLTSLCCRFCDAPLVREATGTAGAITQSTPLPSGLLDELADCLMCFDGPAAVPLESAAACAKPARCLEGETSLLMHVSDLRNTVTVVAEDAGEHGRTRGPLRALRERARRPPTTQPRPHAPWAMRSPAKRKARCSSSISWLADHLRPTCSDRIALAWHVATLLAREVTTRSVHRFELCARTGSGAAQSWRSVHLLLVSWDSEATARNASSLHTVLKLCFQMGNPSPTLHAATRVPSYARSLGTALGRLGRSRCTPRQR